MQISQIKEDCYSSVLLVKASVGLPDIGWPLQSHICSHHMLTTSLLHIFSPGHRLMNHPPCGTLPVWWQSEERDHIEWLLKPSSLTWLLKLSSKNDRCHFCLHFLRQNKSPGYVCRTKRYNIPMAEGTPDWEKLDIMTEEWYHLRMA